MVKNTDYKSSIKNILCIFVIVGVGAFMFTLSWQRWPDILVDFGRELYVAWQIKQGSFPYRDIMYLKGSISPYINALLFRMFGTSIITIATFNLILIVFLTCLIYRFFIETTDKIVATATSTTFLGIFAFSQYVGIGNYNYVTPFSHEWTHGILFSFISIYTLLIYLRQRRSFWLIVIGSSIGIVFLTRIEVFLAISVGMFVSLLFLLVSEKQRIESYLKLFCYLLVGFIIPLLCFTIFLSCYMDYENAISSILIQYKIIFGGGSGTSNVFYLRSIGIDKPMLNTIKLLKTAGWYILILAIFGLGGYCANKISAIKHQVLLIIAKIGIVAICVSFLIVQIHFLQATRALPIVMAGLITYYFFIIWRNRNDKQKLVRFLPIMVLTIFSLLLLLRMILNVRVYHYGFAMAMPATLLAVMTLLYHVPQFIGKVVNNVTFVRNIGIVLLTVIIIMHINLSKKFYEQKTFPVGSGGDTILTNNPNISPRGLGIKLALDKINKVIKPDEVFLVIPNGVMLNYLSRRDNHCYYVGATPTTLLRFGENKVLNAIKASSADYVILVDRDVTEFGYKFFGQDFAAKIYTWINENYSPVKKIGSQPFTGKGFGVVIMKRNEM